MLSELGCEAFVPELINYIQDELDINQEWEFDPSIFSSLLLSSIVGRGYGGVIVDVLPNENEDGVRRTSEHVQAVRSSLEPDDIPAIVELERRGTDTSFS